MRVREPHLGCAEVCLEFLLSLLAFLELLLGILELSANVLKLLLDLSHFHCCVGGSAACHRCGHGVRLLGITLTCSRNRQLLAHVDQVRLQCTATAQLGAVFSLQRLKPCLPEHLCRLTRALPLRVVVSLEVCSDLQTRTRE